MLFQVLIICVCVCVRERCCRQRYGSHSHEMGLYNHVSFILDSPKTDWELENQKCYILLDQKKFHHSLYWLLYITNVHISDILNLFGIDCLACVFMNLFHNISLWNFHYWIYEFLSCSFVAPCSFERIPLFNKIISLFQFFWQLIFGFCLPKVAVVHTYCVHL